mmetsp:Transcript_23075/g.47137  ORF Transcript_23075/g.47137 Transcript_23075/m.47137 type:complete len:154 (+) Transcript_23075:33-494(+)
MGNNQSVDDLLFKGCFKHRREAEVAEPCPEAEGITLPPCGLGLVWLVQNNQLVVAGFVRGSDAERAGVLAGDILLEVDGKSAVGSVHTGGDAGRHPAGRMMAGPWGSPCLLKLSRVKDSAEAGGGEGRDLVIYQQVLCRVFRLLPLEPPPPPS